MTHNLLGKTFVCECGRTHTVPVREILFDDSAHAELPRLFDRYAPGRNVLLLADARTWTAAGADAARPLESAGFRLSTVLLPDPPRGEPACDDRTRSWLEDRIPGDTTALLAVGSGVVNDLSKWVAKDRGIPYMVVATAASMNGYSSANVAPAIQGVKRIVDGRAPFAVAARPAVLAAAPAELTAAGLGDVAAKPVSMMDWQINRILFDDYYCPLCARLIRDLEPVYMEHPEGVRNREPAAMEALFMALLYSGLSMTVAGTSFPASGGEHMMSHVLDMKAMAENRRHDYHGRQVGLGTIVAAALYERILALERPAFRVCVEPTDATYWGTLTPVVEEEHALKRARVVQAVDRLRQPGVWEAVRAVIAEGAVSARRLKDVLSRAGAAHRVAEIGCSAEEFTGALLRSHQIRARYTVLDLARALGILPGAAGELVETWLTP